MTNIPSSTPSSPTPPPKKGATGPVSGKKPPKQFHLPKKDQKVDREKKKDEEKKKKEQPEVAAGEPGIKEIKPGVGQEQPIKEAAQVEVAQGKAAIDAVTKLIQKVVTDLKIGQVGGKDFASLKLADTDVPAPFAGSNLSINFQDDGLIIRFDTFSSPQAENNALTLVEKNKEQLTQLVQRLQSHNLRVLQLSIGTHVIALPQDEQLPPPFQPTPPQETDLMKEGEDGQQGGREGEEREGSPE